MVAMGHGDDASRVLAVEVSATQADHDRLDALAGHALGGDDGGLDRGDGFVEVDHDAFAQPVGGALTHADDAHGGTWLVRFRDDDCDAAGAQVETDEPLPS